MHHSTAAGNENISFIGGDKVPIEFLSCRNTLEAHLRPGRPYYELLTFEAHLRTRGVILK